MSPPPDTPSQEPILRDLFTNLYKGLTDPLFPLNVTDARTQLAAIHKRIQDTSASTFQHDPSLDLKDQCFELLMNRFDLLQACRPVLKELYDLGPRIPCSTAAQLKHLYVYFSQNVQTLHIAQKELIATALSGVYVKTLPIWLRDDTPDLSYTMAAIDYDLSSLLTWGEKMGFIEVMS